jgi:hypothetical protein
MALSLVARAQSLAAQGGAASPLSTVPGSPA